MLAKRLAQRSQSVRNLLAVFFGQSHSQDVSAALALWQDPNTRPQKPRQSIRHQVRQAPKPFLHVGRSPLVDNEVQRHQQRVDQHGVKAAAGIQPAGPGPEGGGVARGPREGHYFVPERLLLSLAASLML